MNVKLLSPREEALKVSNPVAIMSVTLKQLHNIPRKTYHLVENVIKHCWLFTFI